MTREAMLSLLAGIKEPVLIHGGTWQFGHTYFILTSKGVATVDCTAYDPFYGPCEMGKERMLELRKSLEAKASGNPIDWRSLDLDEALLLVHGCEPNREYFFYQTGDNCSPEDYIKCESPLELNQKFVEESLETVELEKWADLDDADLSHYVELLKREADN